MPGATLLLLFGRVVSGGVAALGTGPTTFYVRILSAASADPSAESGGVRLVRPL